MIVVDTVWYGDDKLLSLLPDVRRFLSCAFILDNFPFNINSTWNTRLDMVDVAILSLVEYVICRMLPLGVQILDVAMQWIGSKLITHNTEGLLHRKTQYPTTVSRIHFFLWSNSDVEVNAHLHSRKAFYCSSSSNLMQSNWRRKEITPAYFKTIN